MRLKDKTIIIVGVGGLGRELARDFAAEGANLVLAGRRKENLDEVVEDLSLVNVITVPTDASKKEDVIRLFEAARGHFGAIDAVVIATGSWSQLSLDESVSTAIDLAEKHFASFFLPTFVVGWHARQVFLEQGKGLIINISSHAALRPELPNNPTYGPMKAAGRQFILGLRKTGVRATDIAPAIINTRETYNLLATDENRAKAVQPKEIAEWIIDNFDDPNIEVPPVFDSDVVL